MPAKIAMLPLRGDVGVRLAASARDAAAAEQQRLADATRRAAEDERARVRDILGAPHAAGRRRLAEQLALHTALPVALAVSILQSAAPEEAAHG